MNDIILISLAVVGFICLILVVYCLIEVKKLRVKVKQQQEFIDQLWQQNKQSSLSIEEIRNGAIGMGKAIQSTQDEFYNHVQQLIDKQNDLALQDPDSKLYNRAAKMVNKGATVEEEDRKSVV